MGWLRRICSVVDAQLWYQYSRLTYHNEEMKPREEYSKHSVRFLYLKTCVVSARAGIAYGPHTV